MMACLKLYLLFCTSALAQLSHGQDQNATQAVEEVNNEIPQGEGGGDQGFPPYNYTEPDSSDNPQQVDYDLDAAQDVNDTAADGPATATETPGEDIISPWRRFHPRFNISNSELCGILVGIVILFYLGAFIGRRM